MNATDEVARRHFRGTPLYLETMIATNIVPREIEIVTDIVSSVADGAIAIYTHLYEHDVITAEEAWQRFGLGP